MKLLVISDIHNSSSKMDWIYKCIQHHQPELVICLGDCVTSGPIEFIVDLYQKLSELVPQVFWIPGNHDPIDIHTHLQPLPITSLHNQRIEYQGFNFVGKGGSLPCPVPTAYEESEFEIAASIADILKPGDILCCHNPIFGYRDLYLDSINNFHTHIGSKALKKLVEDRRPFIVLSGHIHNSLGLDNACDIWFINPGAVLDGHAACIDLQQNKTFSIQFLIYPNI